MHTTWILLAVFSTVTGIASAATDKIICYHGSWSVYRGGNGNFGVGNIDPTLCTHLIYSFIGADDSTGNVKVLDTKLEITRGNLAAFAALKAKNPKLKVLVAIGGWSEGSFKYSNIASNSGQLSNLVQSALAFVQQYGLDGLDIDWEYPARRGGAAQDKTTFITLLKELRAAFQPRGLLLTAAVAASPYDDSYDVPSMSKYLDFINVMAYDLHGSWDGVTGQNAPLFPSKLDTTAAAKQLAVASSIERWIAKGASPSKLALGLGFYGRTYTLVSSSNTALGAPVSGAGNNGPYTLEPGMLGYHEICEKQAAGGWTTVWDDVQKNPYTYSGNQWVGYDNEKSIAIKVEYAKSLNLGAVMIWSIEMDDFNGICGKKFGLLSTINEAIGGSSSAGEDDSDDVENPPNEETPNEDSPNEQEPSAEESSEESTENESPADDQNANTGNSSGPSCSRVGYVKDPKDCQIFYYCLPSGSTFIPFKQSCSNGLLFDETAQVCNWASLVKC